jgi:hypothetical protein
MPAFSFDLSVHNRWKPFHGYKHGRKCKTEHTSQDPGNNGVWPRHPHREPNGEHCDKSEQENQNPSPRALFKAKTMVKRSPPEDDD